MTASTRPRIYPIDIPNRWSMYPATEHTIKTYGDIHVYWKEIPGYYGANRMASLYMSIDGGKTWKNDTSFWQLTQNMFGTAFRNMTQFPQLEPVYADRRRTLANEKKEADRIVKLAFLAMTPAQQAEETLRLEKEKKKAIDAKRTKSGMKLSAGMTQVMELSPKLVKLRDTLDEILKTFADGGIETTVPYYERTKSKVETAQKMLNQGLLPFARKCKAKKGNKTK